MEVRLVVHEGKAKGREIPLPLTVFVIGRGQQCHLRPHCRLVSKLHCAIARWAGKVVVRDLKSSNGTYVNNHRIEGEVRVIDGDVLRIGTLEFGFFIRDVAPDGMPVQVVREGDVKWLMDSPPDSFVLNPTSKTETVPLPPEFLAALDAAAPLTAESAAAGGAGVSAGDYLRDYFRQRKQ